MFKKTLFLFVVLSLETLVSAGETCTYGESNQCSENKVCVQVNPGKSECQFFEEFLPLVLYPFPEKRAILCDQGVESPAGNSHTYTNTLYALDLKTPKGSDPDSIKAGIDGVAYVFNECLEHNTNCGQGWGNHVRILRYDGVVVQYAHLEKVWIQTGQFVTANTYIGLEGNTGATGHDNRHLHLSAHYSEDFTSKNFFQGYLPKSIPFKMNICQLQYGTCNGKALDIRHLHCTRKTGNPEWVNNF